MVSIDQIKKVFPALEQPFADMLAKHGMLRKATKGTILYEQGFPCDIVPFFLHGSVRVFKLGESGREITLFRAGPGESCILSTSCGISGASYPAIAEAEDDVDYVAVPVMVFREHMKNHPSLQNFMCEMLSSRLADMMLVVEEVAFRRVDLRLAERLLSGTAPGRSQDVETTHAQLAVDLGTAREVISRILKDFEREGYVTLGRGHIQVTDRQGLLEFCSRLSPNVA
ncbi:MAG: Crp/Fnr family transcriptional regulator [Deltaproteobacteria bacterium]|nr:Crp/Fnr family transcriptional regulator [Deltaproteobacteria bacterium]